MIAPFMRRIDTRSAVEYAELEREISNLRDAGADAHCVIAAQMLRIARLDALLIEANRVADLRAAENAALLARLETHMCTSAYIAESAAAQWNEPPEIE